MFESVLLYFWQWLLNKFNEKYLPINPSADFQLFFSIIWDYIFNISSFKVFYLFGSDRKCQLRHGVKLSA